jgi:hypothetical protein
MLTIVNIEKYLFQIYYAMKYFKIVTGIALAIFVISACLYNQAQATPSQRTYSQMLDIGEVRMAIPYGRTTYVDAKGEILGISPQLAKYISKFLSDKYKRKIQINDQ